MLSNLSYMYDLLFVTGNLIKRIKKRGKESENERGRERLKVQIGLFIFFSVRKRDGIYSQRRISFDQSLRNYDRSICVFTAFRKVEKKHRVPLRADISRTVCNSEVGKGNEH